MAQSRNPGNSWKNKQDYNPRGGVELVVHRIRTIVAVDDSEHPRGYVDHRLGRLRNVQSASEQTMLYADDNNDGAVVHVGGEITARMERFTAELMEPLDPSNQQWFLGNSPLLRRNSQRYTMKEYALRLHGTEPQRIAIATGIVTGQFPTLAGTVTGTPSASGGTLAATTDWIVSIYKGFLKDGEQSHGPTEYDWHGNYSNAKASSAVTTTGATSKITVTFPSDGDCDFYLVTLASATLTLTERVVAVGGTAGEAGDTVTIVVTDSDEMTEAPTMAAQPATHITVQSLDGQDEYDAGVDYIFNAYDGSLARIAGGDIADNQEVVLRCPHLLAPSVSIKLGKDEAFNLEAIGVSLYHVGDDEGRDEVTGLIKRLYNVNLRTNWEMAFSEEDWGSVSITIEGIVRPDPNSLERGFGVTTILSPRIEGVTEGFEGSEAALSETPPYQPTTVADSVIGGGFGL